MGTYDSLQPIDPEVPKEWKHLLEEVEAAGSDRNLVEANLARLRIAMAADRVNHERGLAKQREEYEKEMETSRLARDLAASRSADRHTTILTAATFALVLATVGLVVATLVHP